MGAEENMEEVAVIMRIRLLIRIAYDRSWQRYGSAGPIRRLNHVFSKDADPNGAYKGHFEPILERNPPDTGRAAGRAPSTGAHLRVAAEITTQLDPELPMGPQSSYGQEWAESLSLIHI